MKDFILGSHNSWSYLTPRKWWMKLLKFAARCQSADIRTQYEKYGVRCFDLRIRFKEGSNEPVLAHGIIEYKYSYPSLIDDLCYLDTKGDCCIRVLHEARNERQYTMQSIQEFKRFCHYYSSIYGNIKWWCGRNLYDWKEDYIFNYQPSCEERYASVCKPRIIDDWWPWFYAKTRNKKIREEGTDKDVFLIDFVNIM